MLSKAMGFGRMFASTQTTVWYVEDGEEKEKSYEGEDVPLRIQLKSEFDLCCEPKSGSGESSSAPVTVSVVAGNSFFHRKPVPSSLK